METLPPSDLERLAHVIRERRDALLERWRREVRRLPAARDLDVPTLDDHVPPLLDEMAAALAAGHAASMIDLDLNRTPRLHGAERLRVGFDIVEVVAEYNVLREILHRAGPRHGVGLSADISEILNRVIDRAVAAAVDEYAKEKAREIERRRREQLSFVMHDLMTPASAVQMAGQLLARTLPPEAQTGRVRRSIELLQRNCDRLNALLRVARQQQGRIATGTLDPPAIEARHFDLWPLIERLLQDLRPLSASSEVRFVNEVPTDLTVFADAELMSHVFLNLLSNAIKYTQAGEIAAGAADCGEGCVRCWVRDTGAGIPPDRLPSIFEKFVTDPDRPGGQGLGLTIVKQVVEAHRGTISVESTVGRGTTFEFTLPGSGRHGTHA